jgi:predicted nucleic acid-binding protein
MSADTFVDTHILIYAHDLDAGDRQGRAAALLQGLWEERRGILTTQMLQEFYVNVTVKMPTPISLSAARGLLSTYAAWQVEVDGGRDGAAGDGNPGETGCHSGAP